jgi:hypothetical protein
VSVQSILNARSIVADTLDIDSGTPLAANSSVPEPKAVVPLLLAGLGFGPWVSRQIAGNRVK